MTKPKVTVALLSDEDIPTCFQILSKSFGHDAPFVDIFYPEHDTPSGQEKGARRFAAWKKSAKNCTFLKAVVQVGEEGEEEEEAQERIAGWAVWTFSNEAPTEEIEKLKNAEEIWPDREDLLFMASLWREYKKPRTAAIQSTEGKGAFVLDWLAVHPDYQRLGAGRALVEWGTKAADSQKLLAIVESTPKGQPLYASCGFKTTIDQMSFDLGEEFAERKKPVLTFMTREPSESI